MSRRFRVKCKIGRRVRGTIRGGPKSSFSKRGI